jgi:hypothetical protein
MGSVRAVPDERVRDADAKVLLDSAIEFLERSSPTDEGLLEGANARGAIAELSLVSRSFHPTTVPVGWRGRLDDARRQSTLGFQRNAAYLLRNLRAEWERDSGLR